MLNDATSNDFAASRVDDDMDLTKYHSRIKMLLLMVILQAHPTTFTMAITHNETAQTIHSKFNVHVISLSQ